VTFGVLKFRESFDFDLPLLDYLFGGLFEEFDAVVHFLLSVGEQLLHLGGVLATFSNLWNSCTLFSFSPLICRVDM
jgi:hypothetical protein